jgi:DNA primase
MSKRAERIKEGISVLKVLSDYGYDIYDDGSEQQFRCDLHGDGSDNAPSARAYPESNSFFCFACGKSRDSIALVMEKEGVEFGKACSLLERKYGLSEWVYEKRADPFTSAEERYEQTPTDRALMERRIGSQLAQLTRDKVFDLATTLKLWEGYDLISSLEHQTPAHWRKLLQQMSQRQDNERDEH